MEVFYSKLFLGPGLFSLSGFFFKNGTITAVNRWTLQKTAVNSKVDFPTTKKQRDLAAADDTPPRGAGGGEGHGMAWQLHPCQHGGHQTISPKEKRASEDRGGNATTRAAIPFAVARARIDHLSNRQFFKGSGVYTLKTYFTRTRDSRSLKSRNQRVVLPGNTQTKKPVFKTAGSYKRIRCSKLHLTPIDAASTKPTSPSTACVCKSSILSSKAYNPNSADAPERYEPSPPIERISGKRHHNPTQTYLKKDWENNSVCRLRLQA